MQSNRKGYLLLGFLLLYLNLGTTVLFAQHIQTGHYAPGWNGNLKAGMMAVAPGVYFQNTTMFFNAEKFRDGDGKVQSDDETDYILNAFAIAWRPDVTLWGGDYQAVITPALGNLSGVPVLVDGSPQSAPVSLTDIFFSPFGLGWHWDEFHLVGALGGFAPTGRYELGSDDNTGLGFWTVMPFALGTYRTERGLFKKHPLLLTSGLFYEIHSDQDGHDFRPGDSFTAEWSLGLEWTERTSFGLSGFFYRQVTDPEGADAAPVDKYRSNGIGLTFSHSFKAINLNVRAYKDFAVENGPDGALVFVDIAWPWLSGK